MHDPSSRTLDSSFAPPMPTPVSAAYSELMHYTSAAGLTGIVNNGCLWATHAAFLNDAVEMTHFFDARLQELAQEEVRIYEHSAAKDPEVAKQIVADGGMETAVLRKAHALTSSLKRVTLAFNQPYIFSMSAPRTERINTSGLLSQWRGYGSDGGYAVVFDTVEFEKLLGEEADSHSYQHVQWADVFYYGEEAKDQPSFADMAEIERTVRRGLAALIRGGKAADVDGFYQAISSASCLYKHWGFHEEREVRVVAVTVDNDVAKEASATGNAKPSKKVRQFLRAGIPVPYVELFSNVALSAQRRFLPINRIIVGPHRDSILRRQAVQKLLTANGYECEVTCSEIPYIGR